jgi:hypothetical protein
VVGPRWREKLSGGAGADDLVHAVLTAVVADREPAGGGIGGGLSKRPVRACRVTMVTTGSGLGSMTGRLTPPVMDIGSYTYTGHDPI